MTTLTKGAAKLLVHHLVLSGWASGDSAVFDSSRACALAERLQMEGDTVPAPSDQEAYKAWALSDSGLAVTKPAEMEVARKCIKHFCSKGQVENTINLGRLLVHLDMHPKD